MSISENEGRAIRYLAAALAGLSGAACSVNSATGGDAGTGTPSAVEAGDDGSGGSPDGTVGSNGSDDAGSPGDASADGGDGSPATASGDGGDGSVAATATLFVSNSISGTVFRYAIMQGTDPVLNGTVSLPAGGTLSQETASGLAIGPTGELFVSDDSAGTIYRFLTPLGTPTANGILSLAGFSHMVDIGFVDNELWVPNITTYCTTTPESLIRVSFDTQGSASVAGTVTTGFVGADRGMLWVPATRDLYESQCAGVGHDPTLPSGGGSLRDTS